MRIIEYACKYFDTTKEDLFSKTDYKNTLPRHLIWYYLHNEQGVSNKRIGDLFGKDKRTVIYGISNMKYRIFNQKDYSDMYDSFIREYKKETAE